MTVALQDNIKCGDIKEDNYVLVEELIKNKTHFYVAKDKKSSHCLLIQYLGKTGMNTFILSIILSTK